MKQSALNPVSKKQRQKNAEWARITDEKAKELDYICQLCGKKGQRTDPEAWDYLDGHHIIPRRYNIHTKENCYIVHRVFCHTEADRNVRSTPEALTEELAKYWD